MWRYGLVWDKADRDQAVRAGDVAFRTRLWRDVTGRDRTVRAGGGSRGVLVILQSDHDFTDTSE
jgi:hypothetical protein